MNARHVMVLGTGSVGRRHLRNLAGMGVRVSAMDPRVDRLQEASAETSLVSSHTAVEEALSLEGLDGVVVASPPVFHVGQCIAALERGLPVLLEKPPSPDLGSTRLLAEAVRRTGTPLLLGYTYRWWPPLRAFRDRIRAGAVGRVLSVRCVMSAHLADWHPWERYQDFFMARRDLGGGALLDESHFLDLILWMFGMPAEVFSRVERLSTLEIDTDDNVDAWLRYENGPRVSIHLDLYGRPHQRSITVTGEGRTAEWSFEPNRIRFSKSMANEWDQTSFDCERNDMFIGVASEFVEVIDGSAPTCTADDAVEIMRVLDAMRTSSSEKRAVSLIDTRS